MLNGNGLIKKTLILITRGHWRHDHHHSNNPTSTALVARPDGGGAAAAVPPVRDIGHMFTSNWFEHMTNVAHHETPHFYTICHECNFPNVWTLIHCFIITYLCMIPCSSYYFAIWWQPSFINLMTYKHQNHKLLSRVSNKSATVKY